MKITPKTILPFVALSITTLTGCFGDYDEYYFKGKVLGGDMCTGSRPMYLIEVDKPQGVGDTLTVDGVLHHNVVMGHRSSRMLKSGETVYGVAYNTADYAAFNCFMIFDYQIPEVVLVSVNEDSTIVMNNL